MKLQQRYSSVYVIPNRRRLIVKLQDTREATQCYPQRLRLSHCIMFLFTVKQELKSAMEWHFFKCLSLGSLSCGQLGNIYIDQREAILRARLGAVCCWDFTNDIEIKVGRTCLIIKPQVLHMISYFCNRLFLFWNLTGHIGYVPFTKSLQMHSKCIRVVFTFLCVLCNYTEGQNNEALMFAKYTW